VNKQIYIGIVNKLRWIDQIVGGVWIVLSLLMFISAWIVYQEKGLNRDFWFIIALVIATWTYPLYTLGFKLIPGLVGNILYIGFAVFVITQVKQSSAVASYLLYPITLWVTSASVYIVFQLLAE
jgi:tryptophan-rich sensory protein